MSLSNMTSPGSVPGTTPRAMPLVAILVAATLAAAGCQPAAQEGTEGEAAGGQETSVALSPEQVVEMERGLWEALDQGDHEGFAQQLADDVVLVGGEGVSSKQDAMTQLEGGEVEAYEIGDFQVFQPGADVAGVTYRFSETFRPADADDAVTFTGWATSIWENRDGTWLTVFHQSSTNPSTE